MRFHIGREHWRSCIPSCGGLRVNHLDRLSCWWENTCMSAIALTLVLLGAPPLDAANALVDEIARLHAKGAFAPPEQLNPDVVAKLNTAPKKLSDANPAFLRVADKLVWPR